MTISHSIRIHIIWIGTVQICIVWSMSIQFACLNFALIQSLVMQSLSIQSVSIQSVSIQSVSIFISDVLSRVFDLSWLLVKQRHKVGHMNSHNQINPCHYCHYVNSYIQMNSCLCVNSYNQMNSCFCVNSYNQINVSIFHRVKVSKIGTVSIDWHLHCIKGGVPDPILEPEGL